MPISRRLLDAVRGETVTAIFVTHTHRDHSPAVPKIKAATGATVYAEGPHRPARPLNVGEAKRLDASADTDFRPDVALADGEVVTGDGWTIEAADDAGAHGQSHGLRAQGSRPDLFRRSCDGVVDLDRGAARRRHERLHGVIGKARAAERADLPARSRRAGARCAAVRAELYPPSAGARGLDPAGGSPRALPISPPWCGRSISASIRGSTGAAALSVLAHLEDLVARGVVAD